MPHVDGSPTIDELHLRYDGPIPKQAREAALAGGAVRYAYIKALAQARFWHEYLRTNRRIRGGHVAWSAKHGYPPHPDQVRMNEADLAYALRGLRHARERLRQVRAMGGRP